jgi:hypothetical protein
MKFFAVVSLLMTYLVAQYIHQGASNQTYFINRLSFSKAGHVIKGCPPLSEWDYVRKGCSLMKYPVVNDLVELRNVFLTGQQIFPYVSAVSILVFGVLVIM